VRVGAWPRLDSENDPRMVRVGNIDDTRSKRRLHVADDCERPPDIHHATPFDVQMTDRGDAFDRCCFHASS